MAGKPLSDEELQRSWLVYHEAGTEAEAARRLGINRATLRHRLQRGRERLGPEVEIPHVHGDLAGLQTKVKYRAGDKTRRYIVTCAQNNTRVHPELWVNLLALGEHLKAEILVSRFAYNRRAYGKTSVKPDQHPGEGTDELWFAPEIREHVCDERVELAPGLVFCGELQVEPTARRPLSGFETHAGRKSCIIPHTTFALESVASGKREPTKFLYTTGAVTQMNYIKKRAGFRAENHHSFGALLVEVDAEGRWFVRQLEAGVEGDLQDLDVRVHRGKVSTGHRVEGVVWGDIHAERSDSQVMEIAFQPGGILDTLHPRHQVLHDILDFTYQSHHNTRDPLVRLRLHALGHVSVRVELHRTAALMCRMSRPWCSMVVVNSNHDRHLDRWVKETDWRDDLENAEFLLEMQLEAVRKTRQGARYSAAESALRAHGAPKGARFLEVDESMVLLKEHDGGIEIGMHGDLGPNGTMGNPLGLTRMGRRACTGHTHSARIIDGIYVAGTFSRLDLGYNIGPSSWSHSFVVIYPNGRRAVLTIWDGRWRAEQD